MSPLGRGFYSSLCPDRPWRTPSDALPPGSASSFFCAPASLPGVPARRKYASLPIAVSGKRQARSVCFYSRKMCSRSYGWMELPVVA